ncbi:MAG TPA: sodium:solute symporter [Candidatus Acidoferrales bacterium]|jgi:SSS family transporter|nr:sodium:solute symporter [Candidatus Acidoferrales bacterium]
MHISPFDFAILIVYLAGITAFGARFRRGQKTLRDYFLGGRTAPWWALACSIVATETSTLTIIGTPGIAFAGNLGFLQLVLGYLVARVILCVVLIPQYFQGEFYTAYQLLEKRFGNRMKKAAAVVFLGTRTLAEGVRISAIGKVVSVAFGTGDRLSIAMVAALTMFYTFEGGMRAVIWTDVIQFALYITGSLAALLLLLHKIPGGWHEVTHTAAAAGGKLRIFDFTFSLTRSYTFWSGVIGGTFLTMASHGTDQTMVQRLLAARGERDAKKALLASGVIVFAQFALFLVLGVMLFVYAQHSTLPVPQGDADRIFPEFIVRDMPTGLSGLVLASIFAIAMSNASGSLNSLASSSMIDLGGTSASSKQSQALRRSRWMTLAWGLVLGLLGLIRWGPVLVAGLTIASITYGGLLGVFLLGTWNRRSNETGALIGFVTGIATMIAVTLLTPLAFTWYVVVGTIVTFTVGSVASSLAPIPPGASLPRDVAVPDSLMG